MNVRLVAAALLGTLLSSDTQKLFASDTTSSLADLEANAKYDQECIKKAQEKHRKRFMKRKALEALK